MVKKNSRYGNLNSGSRFIIKDPEPEGGASRQGKKKKARRSNLESIQEDDDNMLKMLKNDENENAKSNHNDLDLPVITD